MTYGQWADEYLKSADETHKKILELEEKRRHCRNAKLIYYYDKKLKNLYAMYGDCMYCARQLRRRADRLKEKGLQNMEV